MIGYTWATMHEFVIRFTGERDEERVSADACAHDLFDLVFLIGGKETRRVAVAEISSVVRAAEPPQRSRQESMLPEVRPLETHPRVERPSRSGPRYRNLRVAGHGPDTQQVDDILE
jgi:hypothetical protein